MKKTPLMLFIVLITAIQLSSCGGSSKDGTSKDGTSKDETSKENTIKEVTIGKQVWMSENLNVDKFRNGEAIPEAKTEEDWKNAGKNKQPAWCYYNNNPDNGERYGKLYNWYAVNDPRGLAPAGFKVPTDDEWNRLIDFLGGESLAGKSMKSIKFWADIEKDGIVRSGNGTNESGFAGLPGGYRGGYGGFFSVGSGGNWWSSSEDDALNAWFRNLNYNNGSANQDYFSKRLGFSVRCLRD
jgi:uncharacterized protein (TIGR02145 family)